MALEHLKEQARRAFYWTSFSPDERGEQTIKEYEEDLKNFLNSIPEEHQEWVKAKYITLFSNWLSVHSRCYSVMITGASGFNNKRHSKANNREKAAYEEFKEWKRKTVKRLNRPDKLSIDVEYEQTLQKIEDLKKKQDFFKDVNALIRKKGVSDEEKIDFIVSFGVTEKSAAEFIKPDQFGRLGFPSYKLQNNL